MGDKPYNGFTSADRGLGANWARRQRALGLHPPPATACCVCGQTAGRLEPHSEDYSAPYGLHIGAYTFCFWCHRMLHARFNQADAWAAYLEALRDGATFPAIHENSYGPMQGFLRRGLTRGVALGPKRVDLVFDRIELSPSPTLPPSYLVEKLARHRELVAAGTVVSHARAEPPRRGQLRLF